MSLFENSYISVQETRAATNGLFLSGDLLLTTASAEPRCVEVLKANWQNFYYHGLILFSDKRESGRKEEYAESLQVHMSRLSGSSLNINSLPIGDTLSWFQQFESVLTQVARNCGRAISVVIDGSCLPKHYLLFLLGFGIDQGITSSISIFYTEGIYKMTPQVSVLAGTIYSFSSGAWKSLIIPYFEGQLSLEDRTRVVVSLGFEGLQSRNFLRSYQADKYAVIVPSSDREPEYDVVAEQESKAFLFETSTEHSAIIRANASSVVETLNRLEADDHKLRRYHDLLITLGSKPHALALGVHALLYRDKSLICRVPDSYLENETSSNGISWIYQIKDKTALI